MDERLKRILAQTDSADIARVAAGALGLSSATVRGRLQMTAITAPRADPRTIGVVKIAGTAASEDGREVPWSAVAKLVDLAETPVGEVQWTRPEIEEIVYEEGYFATDGQQFRPARCYLVSRPEGTVKVFWLEDLTDAEQAPFGVEQLAEMAQHLGEWTGAHRTIPALKFPLPRDVFATRWAMPAFQSRYERMRALDPATIRLTFRDVPAEALHQLRALLIAQNERAKSHPHGLAFGDCQVGNLFHRPGETVAVDWASLGNDPIGADGGSMIGSMLGRAGLVEVATNERALFERYLEGLRASGWRGDRDDVRRGYFCQFGHYLATTAGLMPVVLANDEWPREEVERRLQTDWDAVPDLIAPIIALYPAYIEELRQLQET